MKNLFLIIVASIGMLTNSGEVAAVCVILVILGLVTNKPKRKI